MMIVDAHLDLAYNALKYGRNLLRPLDEIRRAEAGDPYLRKTRGTAMVTFPELHQAGVGLVFGTLFVAPAGHPYGDGVGEQTYRSAAEAHRYCQQQLDYYHRLADEVDMIRLVGNAADLMTVVESHEKHGADGNGSKTLVPAHTDETSSDVSPNGRLIGIVPLMEGADGIREPAEAEMWFERGLRIIGLAWDDTRYAAGAWTGGRGLTNDGRRLLEVMADLGMILDVTHMSEAAVYQALDTFEGMIIASHSNVRSLVPGERQLSDRQIGGIVERGGVIGVVLYNSFLKAGHHQGEPKALVTVDHVVAHIDHICQTAGDAAHVGIGSDLDGGFGLEDIPSEINRLADLALIARALVARGYDRNDVANVMGSNWLSLLRRCLPAC